MSREELKAAREAIILRMFPEAEGEAEAREAAVFARFPELKGQSVEKLNMGFASAALEVGGRWIFKFPRQAEGAEALRREARLLAMLGPKLTMRTPRLEVVEGPPFFTRHEAIPGDHLLSADYAALGEAARNDLAARLALFFAQMHGLDPQGPEAREAGRAAPWSGPEEIRAKIRGALEGRARDLAEEVLTKWAALGPDPDGEVLCYCDGHGWNMAFDHEAGRLNGIYDFADVGLAPLHREFVTLDFVSADLTARVLPDYERLTGRRVDRERLAILTGANRLWKLSQAVGDPEDLARTLRFWRAWAESR